MIVGKKRKKNSMVGLRVFTLYMWWEKYPWNNKKSSAESMPCMFHVISLFACLTQLINWPIQCSHKNLSIELKKKI